MTRFCSQGITNREIELMPSFINGVVMMSHHGRRAKETLLHLPALVPAGPTNRITSTSLPKSGMPSRAAQEEAEGAWRERNPDYFIARRIKDRSGQDRPPEPLRLPPPLSRLPWDIAQSQFGTEGADFIGILGAVLLRSAQSQFRAYVTEDSRLADTLPPGSTQSQMRPVQEWIAVEGKPNEVGVSPTQPPL